MGAGGAMGSALATGFTLALVSSGTEGVRSSAESALATDSTVSRDAAKGVAVPS